MKQKQTLQEVNPITHFSVCISFRDGSTENHPEVYRIEINGEARLLIIITAEMSKVYPIDLIKHYEFTAHRSEP